MRICIILSGTLVLTQLFIGCLLTKGHFTKDGSMWIWNKDPGGRYNNHNQLQIENTNNWLGTIREIPAFKTLKIEATSKKWDRYEVNDSTMFFNLNNKELPNYHSYYTFAKRLNIDQELLKTIVLDFDKLGLNRFYRENEFIAFNTVTYLGYSKGYFYFFDSLIVKSITVGDILDFKNSGEFRYFRQAMFDKFSVVKKFDDHWIEWEETH
jgi:hypothetical protein